MGTLNLLVLLSCILTTLPPTIAQICSNNFTANSTYGINRNLILSSLPYNVTANGGFYTATVPQQDSETIYALILCRGDLTDQSCSYCVNTSSQEIMTNCSYQKDVLDWGYTSECIVRSSNQSFFASLDTGPDRVVFGGNITDYIDEFDNTLDDLVDELISRAAEGNSSLKFATGEKNYTQYQYANIVYGLMQCIPGLSPVDCTSCLRAAVAIYQNGFVGREEVTVMTPSCIFQYALSPFVESSVGDAPPPSPPPPPGKDDNTTRTIIIIVVSTIGSVIGFIVCVCTFQRKRKQKNPKQKDEAEDQISIMEFLRYDFETISIATNNFSNANKLGQGGFGAVYKGRLLNGREIAVKRLAEESQQGEIEFKNEAMLVAKLQHRNLVRLLGFCSERTERLLIYEFVPQLSLDKFIFDPNRRELLGWDRRYKIIGGISRGLLYLHEESQLRIIHRDLKASNVLLDDDMNPKISDFGMARLFVVDETHGSTRIIAGTPGYMAPEYTVHGRFSDKSDVFSFGVLLLEILSGQKNNSIHNGVEGLLNYAWKTWRDGTTQNLIDPALRANLGSMQEMIKCIHIGLQCVQENVAERPSMDSVVRMLSTSISSLSHPVLSEPGFFLHSGCNNSELPLLQKHSSKLNMSGHSINEVSTTNLYPR